MRSVLMLGACSAAVVAVSLLLPPQTAAGWPHWKGPTGAREATGRTPPSPLDPPATAPGGGVTGGTPPAGPGAAPPKISGPNVPRTGGPTARAATPGGRGGRRGHSEAFNWQHWWSNNQFRFLNFDHEIVSSGSADFFLGSSDRGNVSDVATLTPAVIREKVIPTLQAQLKSNEAEVRAAAVKALGRISEGVPVDEMVKLLSDSELHVRFSAAIALGDAGAKQALPELTRVALDTKEDPLTRGFAMVSMGLLGDDTSAAALQKLALGDEPNQDLKACAFVALGLIRTDQTKETMKKVAADTKADENLRAIAVEALGRLGVDDPTAEFIFDRLDDKSPQVRRSAIVALGQGKSGCPSTGEALLYAFEHDRDLPARAFACISLGEQKGPKAKATLLKAFSDAPQPALKAFAAIGLGLLGDQSVCPTLRETLRANSADANLRSAVAVALGLLKDGGSRPALGELVASDNGDPLVRGYSALAIGLIGDRSMLPTIEKALETNSNPDMLEPLTMAVGLLGGKGTSEILVKTLAKASNDETRAHLIHAIGHLRDRSFIQPFLDVLQNPKEGENARVYAVIALGHLGDKCCAPRLSAITNHRNYLIPTDTIDVLTSIM